MRKKPVIKRRGKKIVKQAITVVVGSIFFIAISITGVYKLLHNYSFISPTPYSINQVKTIQGVKDSEKKRQLELLLLKNNIEYLSVVEASASSFLVTQNSNQQIIFSQDKSLDEQISSLQLILFRLTIEGKQYSSLDFRFDKPVVAFK